MDNRRSVMLSGSVINIPESSLAANQPPTPMANVHEHYNQPNNRECFLLTSFTPEQNAFTQAYLANEQPPSPRTFVPHRGGEGSDQAQEIGTSVIKRSSSEIEDQVAIETNTTGSDDEAIIQELDQKTGTNAFRENGTVTFKFQETECSEDYLQPVESENKKTNSPRLCDNKAQTLTARPRPKTRMKKLGRRETEKIQRKDCEFSGPPLSLQFTDLLNKEIDFDQHCTCVKSPDESPRNRKVRPFHGARSHGHDQNDRHPNVPYQNATKQSSLWQPPGNRESPYTCVNCDINWELPPDHLSLFERIGGGSFGQVWKGTACDVIGAKGWSVVAVKMLKGKNH